jgi:hypothetical protein
MVNPLKPGPAATSGDQAAAEAKKSTSAAENCSGHSRFDK